MRLADRGCPPQIGPDTTARLNQANARRNFAKYVRQYFGITNTRDSIPGCPSVDGAPRAVSRTYCRENEALANRAEEDLIRSRREVSRTVSDLHHLRPNNKCLPPAIDTAPAWQRGDWCPDRPSVFDHDQITTPPVTHAADPASLECFMLNERRLIRQGILYERDPSNCRGYFQNQVAFKLRRWPHESGI